MTRSSRAKRNGALTAAQLKRLGRLGRRISDDLLCGVFGVHEYGERCVSERLDALPAMAEYLTMHGYGVTRPK